MKDIQLSYLFGIHLFLLLQLTLGQTGSAHAEPVCPTLEALDVSNKGTLRGAYEQHFHLGVAVSSSHLDYFPCRAFLKETYSSFTAEADMKWSRVQPEEGKFDFNFTDKFVALGLESNAKLIGHTLVWYRSTPDWVFEADDTKSVSKDVLLKRMEQHIKTYVGKYKGQIHAWDVVNEAIDDEGNLRASPWLDIIGPEYIEKAFEYAHAADPDAELYYNDFGLVYSRKQDGIFNLIKRLKNKGVPIHGVGIQGHYNMTNPELETLEAVIKRFSSLGIKVMITELDVSVLPFPTEEERKSLKKLSQDRMKELHPFDGDLPKSASLSHEERYTDLFNLFIKYSDVLDRVTFWGISDAQSWRNNNPVPGREDHPLLFDRDNQPKPLYFKLKELPKITH